MEFFEYVFSFYSLGGALLATIFNVVRIVKVHNKNNVTESATTYVSDDNFEILSKSETFSRSYETKVKISGNKTNK